VYVRVPRSSGPDEIVNAAVHQMGVVNCRFVRSNFLLCFPDGRVANFLPGQQKPFSLIEYKERAHYGGLLQSCVVSTRN